MESMESGGLESVCLDTSILIGHLRKHQPSVKALKKAIEQFQCFVATVSVYELLFGVAKGGGIADEDKLLALLNSVPFDESEARLAAQIHRDLIRRNADIGPKDVMIAATCIANGLSLLTTNVRHFNRVPQLQVIAAEEFIATP